MLNNLIRFLIFHIRWWGKVRFHHTAMVSKHCKFEGANKIGRHSIFNGKMGYGSYISRDCEMAAIIGRFCSIAPYVRSNTGIHPLSLPYVTTSPIFYSNRRQCGMSFADRMMFKESQTPTIIGNDCWIGENVFFNAGLKIGDGAIILAGAIVVKDVPPYAIVGGVPAKVIRYRYDEETIRLLLHVRWWDKDIYWLKEHWELLCDMDKFKDFFRV